MCIVKMMSSITPSTLIVAIGGTGDAEPENILYGLNIIDGGDGLWLPGYIHEEGAGNNITYNLALTDGVVAPRRGDVTMIAFSRISNVIQFYVNGKAFGPPSGTLTAPTGGSTGQLQLPGFNAHNTNCAVRSLKIVASGLTDEQILAEYNRSMGPAFGKLT